MNTHRYILPLLLLILPGTLIADALILRNGKRIEGKVIRQSRDSITIRTDKGTRTVPKNTIRRLVFGNVKQPDPAAEKAKKAAERRKREAARKKREAARKKAEERKKETEKKKQERTEQAAEAKRKEQADQRKKEVEAKRKAEAEAAERKARKAEAERKQRAKANRGGALWRSALVPGWGQSHQGRENAGTWYRSMGTGALATLFFYNRAGQSLGNVTALQEQRDLFLLAGISNGSSGAQLLQLIMTQEIEAAKASANQEIFISNLLLLGLAGGHFWNLRDVWNHGGSAERAKSRRSLEIGLITSPGGAGIGMRVRF